MVQNRNGAFVLDTKAYQAKQQAEKQTAMTESLVKSLSTPTPVTPATTGTSVTDQSALTTSEYSQTPEQIRAAMAMAFSTLHF
jgi:hypothetical protein